MKKTFNFLDYQFDPETYQATFRYQGPTNIKFAEKVTFVKKNTFPAQNQELLDRALFLAWILIGTSYYKANPTRNVTLDKPLDAWQAQFFSTVYQEGLSQFAFENGLARADLANFTESAIKPQASKTTKYTGVGNLVLLLGRY